MACEHTEGMRKRTYVALERSGGGGGHTDKSGSSCGSGGCGASDEGDGETPTPVCHNIVSTSQIECCTGRVDLQRVALLLRNSRYDRKRFAAITIRIEDPTCTGLLFSSGKLVITGSVSMYACILAAHTISQVGCAPSCFFLTSVRMCVRVFVRVCLRM